MNEAALTKWLDKACLYETQMLTLPAESAAKAQRNANMAFRAAMKNNDTPIDGNVLP